MKRAIVMLAIASTAFLAAVGQAAKPSPDYVITKFRLVQDDGVPRYEYIVKHGNVTLKVLYHDSQLGLTKEDFDKYLHLDAGKGLPLGLQTHSYWEPDHGDISQVPEVGIPIHQCVINHDSKGQTTIAVQPTPDPCMLQNGDSLEYSPTPNGPLLFNYVAFDIESEQVKGGR